MLEELLGLLCSAAYSYFILPSKTGDNPKLRYTVYPIMYDGMIIIPISKDKAVHIHHWIIYFPLVLLRHYTYNILWGFSLGLTLQGLIYDDAFSLITENPY